MTCSKSFLALGFAAAICLSAAPASAQHRGGGGHAGGGHAGGGYRGGAVVRGGGGGYRGGAVVRGGGGYRGGTVIRGGGVAVVRPYGYGGARIISPRIVGYGAYRPYYYYRPGISIGFYAGFGYPYYYGYGYGYPYDYGYPYYPPYAYTYPYPSYSTYPPYSTYPGYPASGGYSYPPQQQYGQPQYGQQPQGTVTTQQAPAAYGGVRIEGAPHDAQVYVDGYYAGIVDDFDGANKHLNLTAGTHQVEIRTNGQQPIGFDVNVPPNQTITVRVP